MRKMMILLATLVFCSLAQAQVPGSSVTGSVDVSYQGLYMWRGFDALAGKSAVQITGDVCLAGTGLGLTVAGHRANSSDQEIMERWDYNPYYQGSFLNDSAMATTYRVGYVYYNYPQNSHAAMDLQELQASFALPLITGIHNLVPSYTVAKLWPNSTGSLVSTASGFLHIFMLDYEFAIPGPVSAVPEQVIRLHSELIFNDGMDPYGVGVDHDWSNLVLGAATDIDLGYHITLTPAVNYQITLDKSVHNRDELWATIGAKLTF